MFLEKLQRVKAIVLDVDGVLTDATVLETENGEQLRRYNVRDGYCIKLALRRGFPIAAISGGYAENIRLRLNGLGVKDVFLGVEQKTPVFNDYLTKNGLSAADVLYMGDDMPDLPLMDAAGITACPADAVEEIKELSDYISPKKGGDGCVRDVLEKLLKVQGKWNVSSDHNITST